MFCFLRKTISFRGHIIHSISPTLGEVLCAQKQWLSARYCNSVASNRNSFTVSYLINTCGFSPEEAASALKYVSFETREKPDLVIKFLKDQGFSQAQILRFIRELPSYLRFDPEKTFLPKIEFFKSRGVSSSDIPKIICSSPNIMRRSLTKHLNPSFDFLRDLFPSNDKFVKVLRHFSGILIDLSNIALPNMKQLREVGVPELNVIKLLEIYPRTMTKSPVRFKEIVEEVKEMGFNPSTYKFVLAVYVLSSISKSTWARKANVFKKWGWSDNDILAAFRRSPFSMKPSEDKIDAVMEFLVNKLCCNSSTINRYPVVLQLSLNKRIVPRSAAIQVLLSKGLVKRESLPSIFIFPEGVFLKRIIMRHEKEASGLLKLYQGELERACNVNEE